MLVNDFGAFGAADYKVMTPRPGDPWDNWCVTAAAIWPNTAEREKWKNWCLEGNVTFGKNFFPPWTLVGKASRGLPANFSNDPNEVGAGAVGAVVGGVVSAIPSATKVADAATSSGVGGVVREVIGQANPGQPFVKFVRPDMSGDKQRRSESADSSSMMPSALAPSSSSMKVPLIIAGLAAAALLYATRRKAPMAGFGRYSKRRRRRR